MVDNKDQVVFVSGIGGNLGKSIAKYYLEKGYTVVGITSKDPKKTNIFNLNSDYLKDLYLYKTDITSYFKTQKVIEKINKKFSLNKIINCIGSSAGLGDPLKSSKSLDLILRINFGSIVQIIETILKNNSPDVICNIASISGVENHGHPIYCSSKSALIAYTRSIGRYLSSKNISVFSVSPGAFEDKSGYWNNIKKTDKKKYLKFAQERTSIGRIPNTKEISNFIIDMINTSSPLMSGNNYIFDGGQGRSW